MYRTSIESWVNFYFCTPRFEHFFLNIFRMVMTKQIHTKTVLKDGKEHTTVHEETNVQEDDAPDELRESMQDIINQFMDQPVQQEKQDTSHETEI